MKEVILSCPTLKKEIQHILGEHKLDTPVYFLPRRLHADPKERSWRSICRTPSTALIMWTEF